MSARDCDWGEDVVRALRRLWDEGHSTAEIGRRLGLSKNAVVGKAHRLDLPTRPSPIRQRAAGAAPPRPRRMPVPKLADIMPMKVLSPPETRPTPTPKADVTKSAIANPREKATQPEFVVPAPAERSITRTDKPCCWPIGDPGRAGFRFCEAPSLAGKPYCEAHVRTAYVRSPPKQQGPQSASAREFW